jgi:hypothetical protein
MKHKTTLVDQIQQSFAHSEGVEETMQSQGQTSIEDVFKFSLPNNTRLEILLEWKKTNDTFHEILHKIQSIYFISPLKRIAQFVMSIIDSKEFSIIERIQCAETLYSFENYESIATEKLDALTREDDFFDLFDIYRYNLYVKLIHRGLEHQKTQLIDFLKKSLPERDTNAWRLKRIQHLSKDVDDDNLSFNASLHFIHESSNEMQYRNVACQYILSQDINTDRKNQCLSYLREWMSNESLNERIRADAADGLLRYGDSEDVKEAKNTIEALGGGNTIYENAENVHIKEVEESAIRCIRFLAEQHTTNTTLKTFDSYYVYVLKLIEELNIDSEKEELIVSSLNRIHVDTSVIDAYTLSVILCMLIEYIQTSEHKKELNKRLLEELQDMANTCTSGYFIRLANVLSGYVKESITIGWENQIKANVTSKLNVLLQHEDNMDNIIEEMTNPSMITRPLFNAFFLKHLSHIQNELYKEFSEYLTDHQWDEYFSNAIRQYQQ